MCIYPHRIIVTCCKDKFHVTTREILCAWTDVFRSLGGDVYIFGAIVAALSVNKNKSHTIQPQYLVVCPKTVKSSLEPKTIHPTIISTLSRFSLEVDHFRKYFR